MEEVFPVVAGIVLGLLVGRVTSRGVRACVIGGLGLVLGVIAAWISGELATSWVYVLIDTAQVIAASVMTLVLVATWRRRARLSRS